MRSYSANWECATPWSSSGLLEDKEDGENERSVPDAVGQFLVDLFFPTKTFQISTLEQLIIYLHLQRYTLSALN